MSSKSMEKSRPPVPAKIGFEEEEAEGTQAVAEAQFLIAAGWRKVSMTEYPPNPKKRWLDPTTGKPPRKILVVPEQRDLAGRIEKEAIYQTLAGVPHWYYTREEAVAIQRDRDAAKPKKRP